MNRFLHTPVHRMAPRARPGAGVRWSSYVGDVRCRDNLSKSYTGANNFQSLHSFKSLRNHNGVSLRSLSTNTSTSSRPTAASAPSSASPHERLLVLGSGVAGCAAALTAARRGVRVAVLHAGSSREDCNSYWAQGGIIYRNYGLREEEEQGGGGGSQLVDTPLSLVNDIRVASGYTAPLQRQHHLEERAYSPGLFQNDPSRPKMGRTCPTSGVHWNEDAAWKLACEGPSRVRELLLGSRDAGLGESRGCVVPFDRSPAPADDDGTGTTGDADSVLSLCLEASHAAPRIIHHADCTGKAITACITKAASEHPLIDFVGDAVATDLIADDAGDGGVIGAEVLDKRTNRLSRYYATRGVVLASGGLAGIYQHSTNPLGFNALGSSVGLALRLEDRLGGIGGRGEADGNGVVSDLEYVQFHPTSLYLPGEARFLLTEALRGEGAVLRDADGRPFAADYHPSAELAPRDVVARAVFREGQRTSQGGPHNAYLDITHRDADWLRGRFPSIHAHLMSRDVPMDFTRECVPVVPAAHYTCGGVTTDLNGRVVGGRRPGLYAAGEAARTGLHGGNRLASTSLLEGLVFGASVGEAAAGERGTADADAARRAVERRLAIDRRGGGSGAATDYGPDPAARDAAVAMLARLRSVMWDDVGVVRTPSGLARAASELAALRDEADCLWEEGGDGRGGGGPAGWEAAAVRDAARAGLAVAEAALANPVSGGAHCVEADEGEGSDDDYDDDDAVGDGPKEQDSDDEEDVLVAARA